MATSLLSRPRLTCPHSVQRACLLALLVFSSPFVFAQSEGLRLDQALQLAQDRAASIKAAGASVQANRELAVKADQLPDPKRVLVQGVATRLMWLKRW